MIAAIVPAAGLSARMGRPKLVLPVGGVPVIALVVEALRAGGAGLVVVVVPPREAPGAVALIAEAERAGARVVVAGAPTADMRATVELGLAAIAGVEGIEAILLAPGDSPGLSAALVARVIGRFREGSAPVVVPTCQGKRGHPLLLARALAGRIGGLPSGFGVNALLAGQEVSEVETADPGALADLDTPADYARWAGGMDEFTRMSGCGPSGPTSPGLD